jgi:hypothetical protein
MLSCNGLAKTVPKKSILLIQVFFMLKKYLNEPVTPKYPRAQLEALGLVSGAL